MSFFQFKFIIPGIIFSFIIENAYSDKLVTIHAEQQTEKKKSTSDDTLKVQKLIAMSEEFLNKNLDSASYYITKAGTLSRQLKYEKGILDYISIQVKIFNRQGRYKEGLTIAEEALQISEKLQRPSSSAVAYNNLGNQYSYLGKLDLAASNYLKALKIAEEAGNEYQQQKFSNNLSSVFLELKEKEQSNSYAKKSYQLAKN